MAPIKDTTKATKIDIPSKTKAAGPSRSKTGSAHPPISKSVPLIKRARSHRTTKSTKSTKSNTSSHTNDDFIERYIVIPPDGGWSWVVVFGAFVNYFVVDGSMFSFGIFLQTISTSLGCTKSEVAMAGAIKTGVYSLSGPISAALVNRFGFRKVAVCGGLFAVLACVLTSQSRNVIWFIAAYGVVGGFGFGMIYVTAVTVIGFYFEKWRALATGVAVCGSGCGGIAMPPILTLLIDSVGWRNTYLVMAGLTFLCVLCGLLFIDLKPVKVRFADSTTAIAVQNIESSDHRHDSFFNRYHNTTYPYIMDPSGSVKLTRNTSTEIFITNYPSTTGPSIAESPSDEETESQVRSKHKKHGNWYKVFCCPWIQSNVKEEDAEVDEEDYNPRCSCCSRTASPAIATRPLYRDDIFYPGSLSRLSEYKASYISNRSRMVEQKENLDYHMSITRVRTYREITETNQCRCCPEAMRRIIATMLDFRLLKSPAFRLLSLNAVMTSLGFYTPYMFIKDRGIDKGIKPQIAFWFLSVIGLTNTVGRILCGLVSVVPNVRVDLLCCVFLVIAGLSTALSGLYYNASYQFAYCAIYGLSMSCMSALRTTLIVEMMGLEKLTNAVGIILMFQGVSSLLGTTIGAYLIQATGQYEYSFYFAGVIIALGGLLLIPLRAAKKKGAAASSLISPPTR